ncbi:MAG: site-specific integrase [Nitrospira sp.]|nr:site-specific integrase [Nitrospira sp.]
MGLTKRKDSYYVAFPVVTSEDGKTLSLARGVRGAKLKRWKVGCLNKSVAKELEAIIKTNLMQGKILTEEAKPILFSEWAKQYLEIETVKSLRSFKDRAYRVTHQLVPFFGRKLLTEIKPQEIEAYRAQRVRGDGKPVSLQSINHDHVALKHCLNLALKRGLLNSNPATKVTIPNPQNERDRVLSEEEWGRLYEVAKLHVKPVLLLAYHLGQRFGEITGLTWDRVDLKRGFITLRAMDTKTRDRRQGPMTPAVKGILQQLAKVRHLETNRVFLYKGRPLQRISRAFKTALREAGIVDFRFHDLRHCASTNLRRAGVDTATAMRIVGHKSEKMWKRYNAIEERDLTQAAAKLDRYLSADTVMTLDESSSSQ